MAFNDNEFANGQDGRQQETTHVKPDAYRVEDDDNTDQKDLEKNYLFGKGDNPANPTEGKGSGGENFGQENNTPAGDDKNNPSRNAGYANGYFARNEPSEEHPEDTNFTSGNQQGAPAYGKAQPDASADEPKPEKVERGNGENDRPHPQQDYTEGTDDNDGNGDAEPNIPGPEELPDQQKVGEGGDADEKNHVET